ncbi:MAG: DNA gyrase inhibitor YacG [Betaproteobacteria bacterium]|nr:DNA gyrase inhibitor YacG [Betaproteobacteria bacterium]
MSSPAAVPVVNCPTCGKTVEWIGANRYRPFCSERCKAIDFGAWAAEEYRIPERESPPLESEA